MPPIDDAINGLSSDELDLLNSDPKLLSDFKAKYAAPQAPTQPPVSRMDVMKAGMNAMPGLAGHLGREVMNAPEDAFNQIAPIKTALYDIPKDLLNLPRELAANPDPRQTSLGKFTIDATQGMAQTLPQGVRNLIQHPIKTIEENPISTALTIGGQGWFPGEKGGLPTGQTGGIEGELGSFAEDLKKDSTLARFNKKGFDISESATKMKGYALPAPSDAEIEAAVDNVIKAHTDVVNSFGEDLNEAKSNAGLPTTAEEKDNSIRLYGNKRNLDIGQPLELHPDAPKTIQPGQTISVSGKDLPDQDLIYRGPMAQDSKEALKNLGMDDALIEQMQQPFYDLTADIPGHPAKSSLSHESLQKLGYQLPDPNQLPIGYKISPTKDAAGLNTEIGRFLKNQDYISDKAKIKAASYFQDRVKQYVPNFYEEGDETQGLLKSKYNQLKEVINNSSPELASAKQNFAQMKEALGEVTDKLDPENPGKTQDYLRRVFTSDTQAANDTRQHLAYLEQLSGQPVVSDLFKKFAGREFSNFVSPTGAKLIKRSLPYAVGGAVFGHPGISAGALAGEAALTSPRLIGAVEHLAPSAAKMGALGGGMAALRGYKMLNTPDMQSLKDRLKNATGK